MFYVFLTNLSSDLFTSYFLQVVFRLFITLLASFSISYVGIKYFILFIHKKRNLYQPIREIGLKNHSNEKKHTPTMGGMFIILGALISSLLFSNLENNYVLITLFVMFCFSLIGFVDDFLKITQKNTKGFKGSVKIIIQFAIVSLVMFFLKMTNDIYFNGVVEIPFFDITFDFGSLYILFAAFIIVGAANAVNLTDGLDGLVSVPVIIVLCCFVGIIYATSHPQISKQLGILNISDTAQLIIFCVAMIGSILAFLKFNLKPAKIFMGDVGSLSIGASLGVLAIILKQEILFGIIGLIFVIEALSVILQVGSYKIRKKRIFLMAPIHHHFEKLGWPEKKVVRFFWLSSSLFSSFGMLSFFV
ncbi:MAG: phospho-N-acetylmuramoyl-pentapeptide-transferase [Rickettsiales bacterium]|jgi:phospho-N-acetylmuramoyl-pentapeptide-transferase